ncbi:hypothetical protein GLAREA_10754 [Glarea lozoyensis ATCC 20868]|uniref:Uncharacterized protein n=1 Tax=Glarea lozoyensis (strain ATCC 20868 / MF5171) TaxID=1116229 RepID=S3DD79_GLAL2|nr:uncharacterized protein GLAREA_10754 [Glarea lozoyensis ATCC 20868]EPE35059.1 hypothetical protein GLAREA_10754 [Glarea lozoyensis ATCC 20868]
MPTNGSSGASNGRFQLDLKPVNFSLTEGTNIPPPPASPIEEKPPPTPPKPQLFANTAVPTNGSMLPPPTTGSNGLQNGRGRTTSSTEIPPLSPASSKRPSSIRRFVSRMSLNQNYVDGHGSQEDLHGVARPPSQASVMTTNTHGLKPKRSSSWFRRFSSNNQSQETNITQQPAVDRNPVARIVPQPKLPEKYTLKSQIPEGNESSLGGDDMFKNIR